MQNKLDKDISLSLKCIMITCWCITKNLFAGHIILLWYEWKEEQKHQSSPNFTRKKSNTIYSLRFVINADQLSATFCSLFFFFSPQFFLSKRQDNDEWDEAQKDIISQWIVLCQRYDILIEFYSGLACRLIFVANCIWIGRLSKIIIHISKWPARSCKLFYIIDTFY